MDGFVKRPILFTNAAVFGMLALSAKAAFTGFFIVGGKAPGGLLILSVLFGAAIYFLRNTLPFSILLFVQSFTLPLVCFYFGAMFYLATPFVAYSTAYIGLLNPRRTLLVRGAEYSYGIYLYGSPSNRCLSTLPGGTFWLLNIAYTVLPSGSVGFSSTRNAQ
ncbi:hypothetical protein [Mesorhizobium sp. PL10]